MNPLLRTYLYIVCLIVLCLPQSSFSQNAYPTQPGVSVIDEHGRQVYFVNTSGTPSDTEPMPNGGYCVVTVDGNFTVYDGTSTVVFQRRVPRATDVDVMDENTFLLTSRESRQILVFRRESNNTIQLPGTFDGPVDTDSLPNGNLLVCDAQGNRIIEMKPTGEIVWEYAEGLRQPMDAVRLKNGNTLISDFDHHRVMEVNTDGEVVQSHIGFNHPQKISPLNDYEFVIADSDKQRVIKLNLNGEKQILVEDLNYVVSAVFDPNNNVYLCTVQNRFAPPTDVQTVVTNNRPSVSAVWSVKNQIVLLLVTVILGIILCWNRSSAEWACLIFIAYYVMLFGLGYWSVVDAASQKPYSPGWMFYAVVVLLAVSVYRDSQKALLPIRSWIPSHQTIKLPFSWITLGLLIAVPLLAMITQYYHWVGFADGTKAPWYYTMLFWGLSVYIFLRNSFIPAKNEEQSPVIFSTGSVNEEEEDQYTPDQSTAILHSPEWRKLIQPSLIVILLISACLYGIGAASIPTDVHGDEAEVALYGIEIRDSGNWNIFDPGWYLIPNLFFLIPAWVMWLFGDNLFGVRMAGALVGLATVPVFYLLSRRLLLPFPALIATFLFSVSTFFVHFSRLGVGYNQATFFTIIVMYFLLHGIQEQSRRSISLAGLMAGLGFLSYQAAKILVPLVGVSIPVIMLILAFCSRFQYPAWQNGFRYMLLFGLGVWISFAPLFGSFLKDPAAFSSRTKSVSVFHEDGRRLMRYNFSNAMTINDIVYEQFWRTTYAPISYRDLSPYLYNPQHGGMMDPLPAVLFSVGIMILLCSVWHPPALVLLLWYICLLYPTVITNSAPAYQRLVCVLPVLYLIAAPVLSAVLSQASIRLRHISHIKSILIIGFSTLILVLGMNRYFHQIMSVPQQLDDHTRVARHLHKTGPTVFTYMFGRFRFSIQYGTIRFLAPDAKGMDVDDPDNFLQTPISQEGPVQFLFMGKDMRYADIVKEMYPGGKLETHYNRLGQSPFITYQINR